MTRTCLGAACALILAVSVARGEAPSEGDAALAKLGWLVGGKWVAELKGNDGNTATVEMTVNWAGHRKALKYVIEFKASGRSVTQYDGTYHWHPGKKKLALLQVDRGGNVVEATAAFDGEVMKQENLQSRADGKTQQQRAELTRDGEDAFIFKAFIMKDGNWAEAVSFKYKRVREAK